jgi:MGT family glycosyltransferase
VILISAVGGAVEGSNDPGYFNMIVEALSGSEYHVILSVGEHFPVGTLGTLPKNFEINRYASHLEILPHTDLHLYSGGPNGTLEGLYFGVPLIAIPSYDRNHIIADHLAEQGIVLNLPLQTLTTKSIRENIEAALLDDKLLCRARKMQQVIRTSGGSAMAVDEIERFLAERT